MDDIRNSLKIIRDKKSEYERKILSEKLEGLQPVKIVEKDNFLTIGRVLMEEAGQEYADKKSESPEMDHYVIRKNDPMFGQLRQGQEDTLRKMVGDVTLQEDALVYYPKMDDITLSGYVKGINGKFQFRLNDPSSEGVYLSCGDLQLTDVNVRTIEKLRAAFQNWKESLDQDGTILSDLEKRVKKEK